ncbi:MAG: PTS sugar transporter subunit IIA [Verrucomicrobiales bacterium]|nr:PTS sugar transporter subunit IIA [Verrucomicrobiales bacterium]
MPSTFNNDAKTGMTLADFTSPGMIIPHLRGREAASVIQELSYAMKREARVPDLLPFYHAVLNREFLVSTDMEAGMALPHARLSGLNELAFAFGRSDQPLLWGARGSRMVRLVFLSAVPATDSTQYLLFISGLARLAKDDQLLARLHSAPDTFQILEVLHQVKLRIHSTTEAKKVITQ